MCRPIGDQAEDVAQVAPWLDAVHAAACQKGRERSVAVRAVLAADKQPVLPTDRLPTKVQLRDVVVDRQTPIIEETLQADSLIPRVTDSVVDRRILVKCGPLCITPGKELLQDRC